MALNYQTCVVSFPKLFLFFLLVFAAPGYGAKPAKLLDNLSIVTNATLQARIDALNAREGLDKTVKSKVLSIYQNAQDDLISIETFKAKQADYEQAIKLAPEKTRMLQKDIELAEVKLARQKNEDFSGFSSEVLDQRLIIEKGQISNLDAQINQLDNELILQNSRLQQIRQESADAQQVLEDNQKKLQSPNGGTDSKLENEAREIFLKAEIDAKTAELKMLEYEAISNPARVELLKAQMKLLQLQKKILAPVVSAIESLLTERREREAKDMEDAFGQAERELSGKPLAIQKLTRENIGYSRQLQKVAGDIDDCNERKNRLEVLANQLDSDFKSAEKKISLAGLSPTLGKILREQRRNLPTRSQYGVLSKELQDATAQTSLEQFKIEDKQKKIADPEAFLRELMATGADPGLPPDARSQLLGQLRDLLDGQKELLNKLALSNANYLRALGDYDFAQEKMLGQAEKFAVYLDERLLWVPSSEPINSHFPEGVYRSVCWMLSPQNWAALLADVLAFVLKMPFLAFSSLLALVGLARLSRWAKQKLKETAGPIDPANDRFQLTLNAVAYTFAVAFPVPMMGYLVGSLLSNTMSAGDFSIAIGTGLKTAAIPLLFLQVFYRVFAPQGLACQHFSWPLKNAALLRKQIAWVRIVAVACTFLVASTGAAKAAVYSDSLGRLALIVSLLALSLFFYRVLSPSKGLLKETLQANASGWLARLRFIWFPVVLLVPFVVIGFAVAGYYLSALELQQKMVASLRLVFVCIFIHELVYRWLSLVNRQLAVENAKQKYKARAQAIAERHVAGAEDTPLPLGQELIDIPKVNAQTIRLLNVGIGFSLLLGFGVVWKNILPAFSFFDQIILWQHMDVSDQGETLQAITVTNLLLSGLYIFIVVVSVRNFSGVMELLLFRHLQMETGSRYAINQLARYSLVSIGLIAVANELGGSWSQVQWLVAALGVGLGFGLQEIFANLVSGIILLFERPIRIGDTVTIGEVTGKVCRIQMRATTLTDWDQKELIVPNKTFITSQLVNWTLSNAVTRITIPVGVAYGSDAELAHKVILDTVKSTPMVLRDPEPSVLCLGFGDSSLNFTVYIFVNELANRLPVTHELHMRIEKALREHHISIPFPQRDVHVHYKNDAGEGAPDLRHLPGGLLG